MNDCIVVIIVTCLKCIYFASKSKYFYHVHVDTPLTQENDNISGGLSAQRIMPNLLRWSLPRVQVCATHMYWLTVTLGR